jgi:hypothetical protein
MTHILARLAARGHTYKDTDLTDPLQKLVQDEEFDREKRLPKDGKREVWHYYEPQKSS